MRKPGLSHVVVGVVLLCAPFVVLAASYRLLPSELPVMQALIAGSANMASKSLFTVFRVSLMNFADGLMAVVMLMRSIDFTIPERRVAYSKLFSTLLLTVGLKSDFEAMEFTALVAPTALARYSHFLGFATLTIVLVGIAVAFIRGRKAPLPWPELHLALDDKLILGGLFGLHLVIVLLSFLILRRP